MSTLQPANLEAVLVAYLTPLVGVHVGTRIPNPRPAALVRVSRLGGDPRNMIQERALLLVECYGADDSAAWATAATAWQALDGRDPLEQDGVELTERQVGSPVNFPDPSTTSPRYQFTVQVTADLVRSTP